MPKFTFICEDEPMPFSIGSVTKRTIEFEAISIDEIVTEFELFLRGAGFNPQGTLQFIEEEITSDCQSESYYDGDRNK